ncbi:bifunctional phosphopantothenoylcysteine decarboxylase/phosphopantothenate--cysteine ligase CoaBC [Candidatus Beckwithbacteria bacterium CG23_combo_of_CG06-09_8_20_14_all_47_9]|uniref:Coenzyme A biosynthesis bifunctional protein CoaBC n=1 Tax=Candidatus Beckwithbacteria bacterium CG23_combo_of_CG06-09_8_20_14_all_47_9 TaxID=1974498 RepID=A0A2H0B4J2_9BACT|nr:MAG: bifunctional phosphopantothenoylcysteine decarboxylase/phosphopantothenate--cysteine ligase CoaBC [Candidatus Beckwithbacteria bacterium CG23_combo_of_CG06-09_8_20_14_all_47_9]
MKSKIIILGVSGGIAAVKAPELMRLLTKKGFQVECVLTRSAVNFVKLPGVKVYVDLFESGFNAKKVLVQRQVEHIALADKADLILIAPATANLMAKLAHGIADDYLTTLILATKAPVIICPAMNVNMWNHPAVKENLAKVKQLGYEIINPVAGRLACSYEGLGRLEELNKIVKTVVERLKVKDSLKGKKILVTAGPTREPIDSVRFITNASSGKMGTAIAEAAKKRGAEVRLLMGQTDFVTGQDLLALVKKTTPDYDIIFHTAAVGDFGVQTRPGKLSSRRPVNLRLETQVKILEQIKKFNPKIRVIGFKAEYGLPGKLTVQFGADATIYNDVSRKDIGFASDDNEVILVMPGRKIKIKKTSKTIVAGKLLDFLVRHYRWKFLGGEF